MEYNRDYFKGKTAVVTGAASGIGLALVEELLESNAARVAMADIHPGNLETHEKRLQKLHGNRVKGLLCDVTKDENVRNMIAAAATFFDNKLDLLINNAGAGFAGPFSEMGDEDWKIAFDLNFYSALYGMRAALPLMLKQGSGQIINIISGIAFIPMAYQSRYAATKAALNALSITLRSEYWDENIKISSATPGTTATAIWGDMKPPESAQSPRQSASRILNGIANNDRVIFGDDPDIQGAAESYDYQKQAGMDEYLLHVARQRRKGIAAV